MSYFSKASSLIVKGFMHPLKREYDCYLVKPNLCTLFLTYRCTSRCKTCTMWRRSPDVTRELTLDQWKKIIDILYSQGIRATELFGGDIFMRKDLIPLLHYLKQKEFVIHIPTNGNLIDDDIAKELVNAKVDYIYLSTDGVAENHDRIRGVKGTFGNTRRALTALLNARGSGKKPRLICNTTVSKFNIDNLENIAAYAIEAGFDENHFEYVGEMTEEHIDRSTINGLRPSPYFIVQKDSVLLDENQAVALKNKLKFIRDKYIKEKFYIHTINIDTLSIENIYKGTIPNKKCYIERTEVTIDPYGNVLGCPIFNNYFLGNILEQDFSEFWNKEAHRQFRTYQNTGKIYMCNHCILGVQRNHSFFTALKRNFLYSRLYNRKWRQRFFPWQREISNVQG
jgi:radical SAM protein with 4Fe4S-binding SPASM domain